MGDSLANPLHQEVWRALHGLALSPASALPVGPAPRVLFHSGDLSQGIYLVEEGAVELELSSGSGTTIEVAEAGSVLGLSETPAGGDYKLTAKARNGSRISHIERDVLLRGLQNDHQLCLQIVSLLSDDLHGLYYRFRCLAADGRRPAKSASTLMN